MGLEANISLSPISTSQPSAPVFGGFTRDANSMVAAGWANSQAYATSAFNSALAFINQLEGIAASIAAFPQASATLSVPTLNLADFDTMVGGTPLRPDEIFAYSEQPYTSALLSQLQTIISEWVSGTNTGLPPAVEQAIWDRGRAREQVAANQKIQEVLRNFAARGFSKPPGALAIAMQEAVQKAQDTNITNSREVMVKQADLEQSNRRFAIEQAWKIEEGLINYTNLMAARAFEKAKYLQQVLLDIYQHEVSAYQALTQAYAARVGADVSAFKAQVDVQVAEANLRIEAVKANVMTLVQQTTLLVESVKAGAQVSSQLAAAALSSVSLSGGISNSESYNLAASNSSSTSINQSLQLAAQAQYNYTP